MTRNSATPPISVVIDTTIFVASLWEGESRDLVRLWEKGRIRLCVSQPLLREYLRILPRFMMFKRGAAKLVSSFKSGKNMMIVNPSKRLKIVKEDPADNKFLECAVEAGAHYIISADKHLRSLREYQGIRIVSSGVFLRRAL